MVSIQNLVDTYGVFAYKDPLIYFAIENFRNWKHRELAIRADPVAKIYICKLNEEILSERPIFTPDIFENPEVEEDWETEKWDSLLLQMFNLARTHAFCVPQLYDRAPYWKVFSDREITEIQYDKNDNPIGCTCEWTTSMYKSDELRKHKETLKFYNESRDNNDGSALFVPFGVPIGKNLGEYDLEHIWSLSIWLRYIFLDITNNSAKSSGFYHLLYGDSLSDDKRDDLVEAMDIAGGMRAIGASENALKDIKVHFNPNAAFSIEAADSVLLLIAGASRLPLSFYRGERETGGMNSGFAGFIDESKVTEKKKYVFRQFTPYIKKLILMRWGIEVEDVQPYIKSEQEPQEWETFDMEKEKTNKNEEELQWEK